jgi:hypothetical protein
VVILPASPAIASVPAAAYVVLKRADVTNAPNGELMFSILGLSKFFKV